MEKYGKIWKNRPFFRADMAGLGKYWMGGYGRIGVYGDKIQTSDIHQIEGNFVFHNPVLENFLEFQAFKMYVQNQGLVC